MAAPVSQRLTPKKRERFLEALAKTGNVTRAAKSAHTSTVTAYAARRLDPAFKAAWDEALDTAMDTVLEPEAIRRAVEGVERPVYQGGEKIGTIREYSDTLLIFLLKGGRPARYREKHEVSGNPNEPMILKVIYENAPGDGTENVT